MILVGYIQPFDRYQQLYVLDEQTKDTVKTLFASLHGYEDTVLNLADTYNVNKFKLHGPEKYCLKIKQNIDDAQILKYNKQKLKVEFI